MENKQVLYSPSQWNVKPEAKGGNSYGSSNGDLGLGLWMTKKINNIFMRFLHSIFQLGYIIDQILV